MRTYSGVFLGAFTDPNQRLQIKILDDMLRQVSGGLSRAILPGQSPAANPVPSPVTPPSAPPSTPGIPGAAQGDLLYGLSSGAWTRLIIGSTNDFLTVVGGVPAWAAPSAIHTRQQFSWRGNGPFRVDTSVDGGVVVPTGMTISAVWLYRTTAGTSGSTIIDLNKNGTTMYTTQGNRPTIAFNDGDNKVQATLPDVTSVAAGDILTVDVDQVEGGTPQHFVLTIEGA